MKCNLDFQGQTESSVRILSRFALHFSQHRLAKCKHFHYFSLDKLFLFLQLEFMSLTIDTKRNSLTMFVTAVSMFFKFLLKLKIDIFTDLRSSADSYFYGSAAPPTDSLFCSFKCSCFFATIHFDQSNLKNFICSVFWANSICFSMMNFRWSL